MRPLLDLSLDLPSLVSLRRSLTGLFETRPLNFSKRNIYTVGLRSSDHRPLDRRSAGRTESPVPEARSYVGSSDTVPFCRPVPFTGPIRTTTQSGTTHRLGPSDDSRQEVISGVGDMYFHRSVRVPCSTVSVIAHTHTRV